MSPPRIPSKPMHAWEGDLAVASPAVQRLGEVGGREEHTVRAPVFLLGSEES